MTRPAVEESWPVVPFALVRRGDEVQLPAAVDGDRVLRWIGPLRLAAIRRGEALGGPYLVAHWHGAEGPLVLTGRLYAAGARRKPTQPRPTK